MNTSHSSPLDFDVSGHEALPALRGLFVTGTDTGVGKTVVAGGIARCLLKTGRRVEVFKPVASGCKQAREGLVSEDAEFLAACADSHRPLAEITPSRYASELAPNVAATREGRPVDLPSILDAYRRLEGQCDVVVAEGVGGLLCPITDDFWIIHFARLIALPVVIVARAGLGTINHTLLTVCAARSAGLRVAGVVINRYPSELRMDPSGYYPACDDSDLSILSNPEQIASLGRTPVLTIVPEDDATSVENATMGPGVLAALEQVDWARIAEGSRGLNMGKREGNRPSQ
jgi:dethiobiotin synthetase